MIFSLSTDVIADIVHAYAALELLSADADGEGRRLLTPLLDRERPEPMCNLIKDAFAATVLDLLPYVEDMAFGETTDGLLRIDLRLPPSFPASHSSLLRRRIEHLIAMRVLDSALAAVAVDIPAVAAVFAERHREAREAVVSALRSAPGVFVRSRFG
ncbi:MAG: hypothetical protein K2K65_06070 [Duncaniella sp.]|nr:hypothetical protein [Duncaniella sp.]MDE6824291.1 hypothetical protein [Duncaniella sp.]